MQETIARPYSTAIFELAKSDDSLKEWSLFLLALKQIIADEKLQSVIVSPKYSQQDLQNLLLGVLSECHKNEQNLVKLLIKNKRLNLVGSILEQFEALKAKHENLTMVEVSSAFTMSKQDIANISKILEKKLGGSVEVSAVVDPSLLGGVVIRAGDTVINASMLDKIEQFANRIAV